MPKARVTTMDDLLRKLYLIKSQPPIDDNGRVEVKDSLGQYLLDAARLYEGMSNYRDKKLLREYLRTDKPLHPRRTLDQAYHWTLNSTRQRDRDQVVYRHTTSKPGTFHRYDRNNCKWIEHKELGPLDIPDPCDECKMNIQKLSRVIMVDQLWMWILDAKTIITCFPKRYGTNKQDTSAVHKSIRVHLQDSSPDQIRTVFDLALVIIDECSNTFFNKTKTGDRLPQVLHAFSTAVGNIVSIVIDNWCHALTFWQMHKQTASFERLWRWTEDAGRIFRAKGSNDASKLHVQLLDIKPEGQLKREIKDIIEELDIMIHIVKTQEGVFRKFIANAEKILDPFGKFGSNKKRQMEGRYLWGKLDKKQQPQHLRTLFDAKQGDPDFKMKWDDYNWFKLNADEKLADAVARVKELKELRVSAADAADSVRTPPMK